MCHSKTFVDANSIISATDSSGYFHNVTIDSEPSNPAQMLLTENSLITTNISIEKTVSNRRPIALEKKQCCSCGTFVTPVWRRHSYSSVMNLDSSPLTFNPYSNNDQTVGFPICHEYSSSQKKYLCNACGIKYKKLNHSPVISSRSQPKRKSVDYSVNIKPSSGILSNCEPYNEKQLSTHMSLLPFKQIKNIPKVRRPSTSFIFFCREYRKSLTKQNPSCSFGQISKILGDMWASLPEPNKQVSFIIIPV